MVTFVHAGCLSTLTVGGSGLRGRFGACERSALATAGEHPRPPTVFSLSALATAAAAATDATRHAGETAPFFPATRPPPPLPQGLRPASAVHAMQDLSLQTSAPAPQQQQAAGGAEGRASTHC
ncbi:MAG: hypothetical protein BJ554DRAFT_3006 [Olpidium bornovanus]|uniref:Uncharacterized protein n=1 Tax=Olpidium bornovanus TaxID=278681 RepID=A0A8H7ZPN7_9FUNG|nr:MAG: hypothetical protein BJ554DRAFT_3006 [Olpidium bornovanus]